MNPSNGFKQAAFLGLDVTTTEFALAVSDGCGEEDYASTPMRGATCWRDDPAWPAFELDETPRMLSELLDSLQAKGWRFQSNGREGGYLSVACRQHDQVVLDKRGAPLLPAISWQCNAAAEEVEELRAAGVEATVGRIEPRFVLPKLRCVLKRDPALRDRIGAVFMTGDWIAYALTGRRSLSTSDALSNGLLDQATRKRADAVIEKAGFALDWFPETAPSGTVVGTVQASGDSSSDPWDSVRRVLQGWRFVAGLGDNHASAVGCGMKDDYRRLVVSGGTSGTINLACPRTAQLPADGRSLRFEFYEDALLLLLMLGDCGSWYNRFAAQFAPGYRERLELLNLAALESDSQSIRRVLHCDATGRETPPPTWPRLSVGEQTACTQFSIALELLLRVKQMLCETAGTGTPEVEQYVLTGGLSRSLFFQQTFHAGVSALAPQAAVKVSGRTGPLRYKTSAYGALINAELPAAGGSLAAVHADGRRFPLAPCAEPDPAGKAWRQYLLRSYGL